MANQTNISIVILQFLCHELPHLTLGVAFSESESEILDTMPFLSSLRLEEMKRVGSRVLSKERENQAAATYQRLLEGAISTLRTKGDSSVGGLSILDDGMAMTLRWSRNIPAPMLPNHSSFRGISRVMIPMLKRMGVCGQEWNFWPNSGLRQPVPAGSPFSPSDVCFFKCSDASPLNALPSG